jgi:FMN-dependent NADH-azoreductase
MKKVLVINASARTLNSHSRKLTDVFIDSWKSIHPRAPITFRELGNTYVPHVSEKWIAAAFKPESARLPEEIEALKTSDVYITELRNADIIVVGAPMYNWSIPSSLKAYIDQIMRVNETFKVDPTDRHHPYIGLLKNKTLILLLSRGDEAYEKGKYNEHMNFQSTYLTTVFNIIGIRNIHVIAVNGTSLDWVKLQKSTEASHQSIKELIEMELM